MPTNREVVERFYERFKEGDLDGAMGLVSDDPEMTAPGMDTVIGASHLRAYLESVFEPMPDAHDTLVEVYEAGDSVIVEGRFSGTYREGGAERSINLLFADVYRVRNERITSYHAYYDEHAFLTQAGLITDETAG